MTGVYVDVLNRPLPICDISTSASDLEQNVLQKTSALNPVTSLALLKKGVAQFIGRSRKY